MQIILFLLLAFSIYVNERSRAVSVSSTGEKHYMQLDEAVAKSPRNEQFLAQGDGVKATTEPLVNQSCTKPSASHCFEYKPNIKKRSKVRSPGESRNPTFLRSYIHILYICIFVSYLNCFPGCKVSSWRKTSLIFNTTSFWGITFNASAATIMVNQY